MSSRVPSVALAVVLTACGGGGSPAGPTTPPTGTTVGPSGGTVTSSDGAARLVVPAGALPASVPLTEADTTVAVEQALRNQSRTTNAELQSVQAKRRVTEARLNNGFNARVSATVGFNQRALVLENAYDDLAQRQQYALNIQVPLVQWGLRKAQVEAAQADQARTDENTRAARDAAAEEAHFAALQLAQSARNLTLSAKADTVALKRFEVAKNRYIVGKIGIDNLYVAQNERDGALRGYIDALRGYWQAYYRLRRLTLYDFAESRPIR